MTSRWEGRWMKLCAFLLAVVLVAPVFAETEAKLLPVVRKNFLTDREESFKKIKKRFSSNSVYQPLLNYWSAIFALRRNNTSSLEAYIKETISDYLRQTAQQQLLEYHLNKKNMSAFVRLAKEGPQCAKMSVAWQDKEARNIWDEDKKMSDPLCLFLYRQLHVHGIISENDLWDKIRILAGEKRLAATKRLLHTFPGRIKYSTLRKVVRRSKRYLLAKHSLKTRAGRELVMISAIATARKKPSLAIARWKQFSRYFSAHENQQVWAKIAEWATRWRIPQTLSLYQLAGDARKYDDSARAWRVRAALQAGDFMEVLRTIEAMPTRQQEVTAWRYWHAFALSQNSDNKQDNHMMIELAENNDDFYGLLAREATKTPLIRNTIVTADDSQITGDLLLALAVFEAGENTLARKIWRFAIKDDNLPEGKLLAAAQQAQDKGWHLASIAAANDIAGSHSLRFPKPFASEIEKRTEQFGLDTALVFGLIRQESRFMPNIRSSAGARGLMQVMPATARLVARKHKYSRYRLSRLTRPDTNVIIGSRYLADLVKQFKGDSTSIVASYNAGPSRIKRWRKSVTTITDQLLQQLVFIETIPIFETRLYVKHVLANRAHYDAKLGRSAGKQYDWLLRPAGVL